MLNGECWRLLIRQHRLFFFFFFLSFTYSVIHLTFLLHGFRSYSFTSCAEPQRSTLKDFFFFFFKKGYGSTSGCTRQQTGKMEGFSGFSRVFTLVPKSVQFGGQHILFLFFLFIFLCLFLAPPSRPHSRKISEHLAESLKISFLHDFTH